MNGFNLGWQITVEFIAIFHIRIRNMKNHQKRYFRSSNDWFYQLNLKI